MTFAPPQPPLPWYKQLYYRIEPRFVGWIRRKISTYFFMRRLKKTTFPLVRHPFPTLSTDDICSVQPMTVLNGLFTYNSRVTSSRTGITGSNGERE